MTVLLFSTIVFLCIFSYGMPILVLLQRTKGTLGGFFVLAVFAMLSYGMGTVLATVYCSLRALQVYGIPVQ